VGRGAVLEHRAGWGLTAPGLLQIEPGDSVQKRCWIASLFLDLFSCQRYI